MIAAAPPATTPLPRQLDQRDTDRLRRYREYLDYHEGRRGGVRRPGRPGERAVVFNYARSIVEKGASYLVTEHEPEVHAADADTANDAERLLRDTWEMNDLARLDAETEIDHTIELPHTDVKRYGGFRWRRARASESTSASARTVTVHRLRPRGSAPTARP